MAQCGIYKITCLINNKVYIGQAVDILRRWREHRSASKDNKLYRSANKYGWDNFNFEIIEECKLEELNEREIYWIEYYSSYYQGLNETFGGEGGIGNRKLSDSQVQKIINLLKEDKLSQAEIAELYHVSRGAIDHINLGISWIQQDIDYPIRKRNSSNRNQRFSDTMKNKYDFEKDIIKTKKQIGYLKSGVGTAIVDNNTQIVYPSRNAAAKAIGLKSSTSIWDNLQGTNKSAGGTTWRIATAEETEILIKTLEEGIK